jgi:hypothetical protein
MVIMLNLHDEGLGDVTVCAHCSALRASAAGEAMDRFGHHEEAPERDRLTAARA